jgi:hypothetical protein
VAHAGARRRRDPHLVSSPPAAVKRIELSEGAQRLELARAGGSWRFVTPKLAYDADRDAVEDWLAALSAVEAPTRADGSRVRKLVLEGGQREAVACPRRPTCSRCSRRSAAVSRSPRAVVRQLRRAPPAT